MATERPVQIAICERHGLKYNAATEAGCVRCRRESGEGVEGATPAARRRSAPVQLLVAALLVGTTGALFCAAQRPILAGYPLLRQAAARGQEEAPAPDPKAPVDGDALTGNAGATQQQLEQMKRMQQLLQQVQRQQTSAVQSAQGADEQPR